MSSLNLTEQIGVLGKGIAWIFAVVVILNLLPLLLKIIKDSRLRKKLRGLNMPEIDELSGRHFEWLLREVYRSRGAKCVLTPYCGDWGADLVFEKKGVRTVVQAKRYRKPVGVRAVQEVVASKAKYQATEAVVVTNSSFTKAAIELARVNRVRLRDRRALKQMILQMQGSTTVPHASPE